MASDKLPPVVFDDDNPEWTDEDFARARPAAEVLSPDVLALFAQPRPRGRPAGSTKERITIRIDRDVLALWRATGSGWQSRLNDAIRKVAPTPSG